MLRVALALLLSADVAICLNRYSPFASSNADRRRRHRPGSRASCRCPCIFPRWVGEAPPSHLGQSQHLIQLPYRQQTGVVVTFAPGNKTSNDRRNRTPLPHFSLHPYDFLSLKLKNAEKLLFDGCFSKARIESFAFHMNYPGLFKRRLLQSTASFATRIKWYYNVSTLVVQFHGGRT